MFYCRFFLIKMFLDTLDKSINPRAEKGTDSLLHKTKKKPKILFDLVYRLGALSSILFISM